MIKYLLILIGLILASTGRCAQLIGGETLLPFYDTYTWNMPVNTKPGTNETVQFNPPQFQWSYCPDSSTLDTDTENKNFIFQVSSNANLSSPTVSNLVYLNYYNTLAPLTNGVSTWYWSIGWCHESNSVAYSNMPTRSFTISAGATNWDRSMLADTNFLAAKSHPYMLITAANRVAMSNYLYGCMTLYNAANKTDRAKYDVGHGFLTITNIARRVLTNTALWPSNVPTAVFNGQSVSGDWCIDVGDVALMFVLEHSLTWSNSGVQLALEAMANYYVTNGGWKADVIDDSKFDNMARTLALGYDWCYELMNATQRTNVLYALAMRSRYIWAGFDYFLHDAKEAAFTDGRGDPSGVYTNGFITRPYSQSKFGHSHGTDNWHNSVPMAFAGVNDHPWCKDLFDASVNYMLGPTYAFYGFMGQGRPYTLVHLFENKALTTHCIAQASIPEAGWTNNPKWRVMADWWDRVLPVQAYWGHEAWGETTYGQQNFWQDDRFGRFLAHWTQEPRYFRHWTNEWDALVGPLNHSPFADTFWTAPIQFAFPTNLTGADTTNLSQVFPESGWMVTASGSPSVQSSFTNGVGIIFQARPAGSVKGHAFFSDGSFQMWAYGANVTDAGGLDANGSYGIWGCQNWAGYALTVNGIGEGQPLFDVIEPYYSKITAYTNCDTFTYCAADLTRSYVRSNFTMSGDAMSQDFINTYSGGKLSYVSNVTRELLFHRKKFLVIYDTLQTVNAATNYFSWVYHIAEPTLNLDSNMMTFSYTSTNCFIGSNVTTYVSHIVNSNNLTVTNRSGYLVRVNPYTGENYWTNAIGNLGDKYPRANTLWFNNKTPANNWNFMTVIYPVKWGDSAPIITRIDDKTVAVTNGSDGDVISWDTNSPVATLIIATGLSGESGNGNSGIQSQITGRSLINGKSVIK